MKFSSISSSSFFNIFLLALLPIGNTPPCLFLTCVYNAGYDKYALLQPHK